MKKSETKMKYIDNGMTMALRLAVCCLVFFALAGNALSQSDNLYVIKRTNYFGAGGEHYLAHVKVDDHYELQDATEFGPNCLWYSGREINLMGTNHNYYFIDDANQYRFLSAPLSAGGSLSLSDSKPPVYLLNNTDMNYYFYDWDSDNRPDGAGLARGHQDNGVTSETCTHQWENDQCWEVYWVECDGSNNWNLSDSYSYHITSNAGRFRLVTVESFPMEIVGSGGLSSLDDFEMEYPSSQSLSATITPFSYIPAYNQYDFDEVTTPGNPPTLQHHTYYYPYGSSNTEVPSSDQAVPSGSDPSQWTYNWTISGAGAEYLTLTNGTTATPTLAYSTENTTGHKTATLTLTVTYQDGSTQTTSATVTVLTSCQNPSFSASVNYSGVTISWTPTAESYTVSWKKTDVTDWSSIDVMDVTSYTLTDLEYNTAYHYKVKANCASATDDPTPSTFTTYAEPAAMIGGAVFGGGRMANVGGWTEVVIINTDSIGAVYGGNDIAGEVLDPAGSTIKLGVTADDPDAGTYNTNQASNKVRIGDVYGGGNGYYAYNGSSFVPADNEHTSFEIPNGETVKAMTQMHQVGDSVWGNNTGAPYTMIVPTIVKTAITVNTNVVKVDSIFGGAKNAFITNTDEDDGTSITVNGGTVFAVFGGNNFGGNQTDGKHIIAVNNTKVQTTGYPTGLGRNYGICYVFGGGNKVVGLTTDITINGGMCDTVFAGGNAADVGDANVLINCPHNKTFTNAVSSWDNDGNISGINDSYAWNGKGIYNVRVLFGGNNRAPMHGLPTITLTRGSVGTVYGGGNSGNMLAQVPDDDDPEQNPGTGPIATDFGSNHLGSEAQPIYYGTYVKMNSANMLVDYLYGGCQMSDVEYSTWVEIEDGHVGTVYGGCNISGDVGSEPRIEYPLYTTDEEYQLVKGSTYVKASGGTIYGNLFAGSNGFYHCNDGVEYISGLNFGEPPYDPDELYVGDTIPTHNETHVMVSGTAVVKGNVYAGGNMAFVGFINATDQNYRFRDFVGFCSVRMDGGTVEGDVYGGGNRASIFGSNEVQVSGGVIGYTTNGTPTGGALYGGNDRAGQVAQITNRVLPDSYSIASDGETNLKLLGVKTYVGITGKPLVNTVYGGGNGAYDYNTDEYCDVTDQPVQSNTFVDVNIDAEGGEDIGGYINTVYGGGNGVTVLDRITVFVNVENMSEEDAYDHVGTIFGGNNKGDLDILSDIIMLNGQVNTIYGGCNEGAMTGNLSYNGYDNLGSMVHLRDKYKPNGMGEGVDTHAKVTGYVYGGCRSNGVTNNTLVLVDGGDHPATFFGGSDISGIVGGTSQVIVTGGSTGDVYGGGNGNYSYSGGVNPPYCYQTNVEALGGTCTNNVFGGGLAGPCGETHVTIDGGTVDGSAFGGGYAGLCGETHVTIADGTVSGSVFGGGNEAGVTTADLNPDPDISQNFSGDSNVEMSGGFVGAGVYGGCNAQGEIGGDVEMYFTGGTVGTSSQRADIHGGGYGQPTTVAGDVLIIYGVDATGIHNENLNLYGDLYGGSALGNVNTYPDNNTTIHIDNGTIHGNVYGGGLGYKDEDDPTNDVEAKVFGEVHVNVGGMDDGGTYFGQASFDNTSIFGCNNLNGSPQADVYVDVYQTHHIEKDSVNYTASDRLYAIHQTFGGGNLSSYAPAGGSYSLNVAHVHIHGCENTIEEVFGGSNAAHSISVSLIVDGGRFNFIFGGGNGIMSAANVGVDENLHHTYSQILGGRVGYCFGGSNRLGNCINIVQDLLSQGACDPLTIDYFYQGGNMADQYGEMVLTIDCDGTDPKSYLAAYGGCRLGTVYGNITCTIKGGEIGSFFGGNQGDEDYSADVKRFPTREELDNAGLDVYSQELRDFLSTQFSLGNNWYGRGGNITVIVKGGAIGNLYGGCDANGNVEGKIVVIVENEENDCGLFIGNVYGGSNHNLYKPENPNGISPRVNIIKATVGGNYDFNHDEVFQESEKYAGNVFGGGNEGNVISNTKVNISDGTNKPVRILGDVYGGGNEGDVRGSAEVFVVPDTHTLTVTSDHGTVTVGSNAASSSYAVGEDVDINIVATAEEQYAFSYWEFSGDNASVGDTASFNTYFTMGTENATLTAHYVTAHLLTLVADPTTGGSFIVNGVAYTGPIWVAPGATVTIVATPASNYSFSQWTVSGHGSTVINPTSSSTHFVMGDEDATLTGHFIPAHQLTLVADPEGGGTFRVNGIAYTEPVWVAPGATVTIVATPTDNYDFGQWTVAGDGSSVMDPNLSSTHLIMGNADATLTATFTPRRASNNRNTNR